MRQFCPHGAGKRCREAHWKEDARVIAGAYAHGGFYGVVGLTSKYPETIRYVNAFLKAAGVQGSWTALSIGWNSRSSLHRDARNARDCCNFSLTMGDFQGGRLWIEDSSHPVLQGKNEAHKVPYSLELPNGDFVDGGWYNTFQTPTAFPGHLRHLAEDWTGDRFVITAYTPRGRDQLSLNERDSLRSFGFPVGHVEVHGGVPLSAADREAVVRPKKSVRKRLWKQAMQASVMLTMSVTVASSYFGELFGKNVCDGPAILEVGGFDMTSRVADWGRDVVEPIEHAKFFGEGGEEFVSNLTSSLVFQVLWIHASADHSDFAVKAGKVTHKQLEQGGVAVLEGDLEGASWGIADIKSEFSGYNLKFSANENGQEVTFRPPGSSKSCAVDQEAFVQDVVVPEGQREAPGPRGASAIIFDPGVPQHIAAALARVRQNLGHPENRDLTRRLRYAGADQNVLKASKSLRCQTCERCKRPGAPRPASLPSLLDFNQVVSLDVFHIFDSERVRHELLSVIDHSTTYHLVKKIPGHSSADFEAGFVDLWGADLETGLQAGLSRYAEFCGSHLRAAAGQAHWQVGAIERHGRWFQEMLQKVVDEHSVTGADLELAVAATCAAKNELRRKHGFSPAMAVFGREPRYPEDLDGGHDDELFLEILSSDRQRQREVALRTAARVAFFQTRQDSKFRRALIQCARVHRGGYAKGEFVCFYYRIEKRGTKNGRWRGPGVVLGEEGGNYWVRFFGRCHLVAAEHLREASSEEINDSFSNRVARADLEKLLGVDQDDPNNYADANVDLDEEEDVDLEFDFTDAEMEPPPEPDVDGRGLPRQAEGAGLPPPPPVPKRVRRKGLGEGVQSAMMLKKCLTERSREKQREKELPWHCVPPELHQAFKQAEGKQIKEHYDHSALTPLTAAESDVIRATIPGDRILTSRFAYKDKNYARRKLSKDIEWRPKARLVVGGHKDPDAPLPGYQRSDNQSLGRVVHLAACSKSTKAGGSLDSQRRGCDLGLFKWASVEETSLPPTACFWCGWNGEGGPLENRKGNLWIGG